ncbi:MAG: hypothetical protein HQ582_11415, partial [Planctomycetes bacterium]|nr:hypothetical protein [Planctomycetota bacterium]
MTPTPQPEATPAYQDRSVYVGDALDIMRSWPADWVDLVFFSPPYEDARLYGI